MTTPEFSCVHLVEGTCTARGTKPSKAEEGRVTIPYLIEDGGATAQGLICLAAGDLKAQESCDTFIEGDGTESIY